MAKGMYLGVDSKARKVKKAYIGVDGKARKIKKMYIGDANGKARLFWSGVEFKPYLLYQYSNSGGAKYHIGCTADLFESMPGTCSAVISSPHSSYAIDCMTYFNDKYFTVDSNGGICYSSDGTTYTKVNFPSMYSYPKVAGGKICLIKQAANDYSSFNVMSFDGSLNYKEVTISYEGGENSHQLLKESLFYSKATNKYYFVTFRSAVSGSQYGSGGNGAFRMFCVDSLDANSTATDLGEFGTWSFSSSSSSKTGYQDVFVGIFEQDGKMLMFNRNTVYLFDPTTKEATRIYENNQPTNNNSLVRAVYRISDKDFLVFSNAYTYHCAYNNGSATNTWTGNTNRFVGYRKSASSGVYTEYAGPGDGNAYTKACGGIGYNGNFYYGTFHKKDNKPKMLLHYTLDKGATWTRNGTQDSALTLSNTTGIIDTGGAAIRFSTSMEIENEAIVSK